MLGVDLSRISANKIRNYTIDTSDEDDFLLDLLEVSLFHGFRAQFLCNRNSPKCRIAIGSLHLPISAIISYFLVMTIAFRNDLCLL